MRIEASYPVVVTERLRECRDFYIRWFDFVVAFEASWFVLLMTEEELATTLAFMHPDHPSLPPPPAPYAGDGAFITFQVADARAEYERLSSAGFEADLELTDEPWGQRRFGVVDSAGMWVDVVSRSSQPKAGGPLHNGGLTSMVPASRGASGGYRAALFVYALQVVFEFAVGLELGAAVGASRGCHEDLLYHVRSGSPRLLRNSR